MASRKHHVFYKFASINRKSKKDTAIADETKGGDGNEDGSRAQISEITTVGRSEDNETKLSNVSTNPFPDSGTGYEPSSAPMPQSSSMEPWKPEAMRIVLVGKTGVGKSASGNTILGREGFESEITPSSVTSQCKKKRTVQDGREVFVIDTPGLFDTNYTEEEVKKEIAKCICLASPGPHAFLVTIQLGRFTEEEQKTVKMIQQIFGTDSAKYTMALFSHGDRLKKKTIEEFVSQSKELKEFTDQCRGGIHVLNNEDQENRTQVIELLQKIEKIVTANGGGYYTTEMFQKAEAEIEKEKERILRENQKEREREIEELRRQIKDTEKLNEAIRELQAKHERKARRRAELGNRFIAAFCGTVLGGVVGALVGGAIGIAGGPIGVIIGAAVGGGVGAGIGAGIGAGTGVALGKAGVKCTIQ